MNVFLACHRGARGDFIMAWPSLFLLRKEFADFKFVGVGRPEYLSMASSLGLFDSFADAESAKMLGFFEGTGSIPDQLENPSSAALWLKEASEPAKLLRGCCSCKTLAIDPFPKERLHVALYYLEKVCSFFKIEIPPNPSDCIPDFHEHHGSGILIHPGSGSAKKNYSPEFYLSIADSINGAGYGEVSFILGPVELEMGLERHFRGYQVIMPKDVLALSEVLRNSRLYIGNDSGASHLSAILGVPTIALYKASDPAVWGILGRRAKIIEAPDEGSAKKELMGVMGRMGTM